MVFMINLDYGSITKRSKSIKKGNGPTVADPGRRDQLPLRHTNYHEANRTRSRRPCADPRAPPPPSLVNANSHGATTGEPPIVWNIIARGDSSSYSYLAIS